MTWIVTKLGSHKRKFLKAPSNKWSFEICQFHRLSVSPSTQPFYRNRSGFFIINVLLIKHFPSWNLENALDKCIIQGEMELANFLSEWLRNPGKLKSKKIPGGAYPRAPQRLFRKLVSIYPRPTPAYHIVCAFGEELSDQRSRSFSKVKVG